MGVDGFAGSWQGMVMYVHHSIWTGYLRMAAVRCCAGLLAAALLANLAGCPDMGSIVLPATQGTPDRVPPAGLCRVSLTNQASYTAFVQVDCYIGQTVVHHTEVVLAPANTSDTNSSMTGGWDEADRVVIAATINSSRGKPMWSEEKTYLLGTDFQDSDTIIYAVIYPPTADTPVAIAYADSVVSAGSTVMLDGSASYGPGGLPLSYSWEQISGPAVSLVDTDKAVASFAVPTSGTSGTLVFRLTVSDGLQSAADEVSVAIANRAPVASVTAATSVNEGNPVSLDGTYSFDPDGDPLTYKWEQISGTPVTITNADKAIASFTAPPVGVSDTLIFRLTVSDGQLTGAKEWSVVVQHVF